MYNFSEAITLVINKFPDMKLAYELDQEYYEDLSYLFYETEFIKFIKKHIYARNNAKLLEICGFIEELLDNGDEMLVELVGVTIIESIYFETRNNDLDIEILKNNFGKLSLKSYQESVDYFEKFILDNNGTV